MQYFTDGTHVARVHTVETFGSEFSQAKAEVYNYKRQAWVESATITVDIRWSGDWMPTDEQFVANNIKSKTRGA